MRRLRPVIVAAICVVAWTGVVGLLGSVPAAASGPLNWSSPTRLISAGNTFSGLSCPSLDLCVATTSNGQILYSTEPNSPNPTSAWYTLDIDGSTSLQGVSCPTTSFCAVVDASGYVFTTTDPTGPSSGWQLADIDSGSQLTGISCPTATLCVASSYGNGLYVSTDPAGGASRWTDQTFADTNQFSGVDCPTTTFCAATPNWPAVVTSTSPTGSWSWVSMSLTGSEAPDCPDATFCAMADNAIVLSSSPTSSWTFEDTSTPIPVPFSDANAVACTSSSFCLVGDATGDFYMSTDPTSGSPTWTNVFTDPFCVPIDDIACTGTTFCVGLDNAGYIMLGATSVTGATFSASPAAAGASATWVYGFTTGANGALTTGASTITLQGPSGTTFSSTPGDYTVNGTAVTAATVISSNRVMLTLPTSVANSTAVTVDASHTTNPAGSYSSSYFPIFTSADVSPVNPSSGATFISSDGSGTMTVSPVGVYTGSSGNELTFTFTAAAGGTTAGAVYMTVPPGWTPPSTTAGTAGYTTASTGTLAVSGQDITVSGVTLSGSSSMTVSYGSGGGADGALAPSSPGATVFSTEEASSSGGTPTALLTSPTVTVLQPLTVTTSSLPGAVVGSSYSQTLQATGGTSPYTWSVASGSLPSGLSLNSSTGVISGMPTQTGASSFTVDATDGESPQHTASQALSITVGPALAITTASLPSATQNVAYTTTLAASGGASPYTWSIASGSLPSGLSLNPSTGVITGTPTPIGTASFAVRATDGESPVQSATQSLSLTVSQSPVSSVILALSPASVTEGGEATVAGAVYSGAEPVAGAQVTLSLARGSDDPTGTLGTTSLATDGTGAFATTFTAPAVSGAVTVTASVYGSVYQGQTVVIVSPAATAVQAADTAQSDSGCGTATANAAATSETGCGAGTFAVAQYAGNPATVAPAGGGARYFDAAVSASNTFTRVIISECSVSSGDTMSWWDQAADGGAGAWQAVSPAPTYTAGPPACLTFNAEPSGTVPTISDLYGTVFVVAASPAAGAVASASPAALPEVTAVTPSAGPAAGGTQVTIVGSGFTGATDVAFGATAASSYTVQSDGTTLATAPPGSGTVDITVTAAGGTSATGPGDRFTYTPAPACVATFPDVPATYWAVQPIATLQCRGIVEGFPDGTFRPDGAVTRAQFVKMLILTMGLNTSEATTPFTDVAAGAWYAPYVAAAVRADLVQGVSSTMFAPDQPITREQMAVLLARALHLTKTGTLHFTDAVAVDGWALQGVEAAVAAGYIGGFPDGSLQPLGTATRAQACQVLDQVLKD